MDFIPTPVPTLSLPPRTFRSMRRSPRMILIKPLQRMYYRSSHSHYLHLSSSPPPPYRHHQLHARPATQAEGGAPASWFTDLQIQAPHWSTPGHVTLCQASNWWLWLPPNMLVMANFYCLIQDNLLLPSTVREQHGGLLSDSRSCSGWSHLFAVLRVLNPTICGGAAQVPRVHRDWLYKSQSCLFSRCSLLPLEVEMERPVWVWQC